MAKSDKRCEKIYGRLRFVLEDKEEDGRVGRKVEVE